MNIFNGTLSRLPLRAVITWVLVLGVAGIAAALAMTSMLSMERSSAILRAQPLAMATDVPYFRIDHFRLMHSIAKAETGDQGAITRWRDDLDIVRGRIAMMDDSWVEAHFGPSPDARALTAKLTDISVQLDDIMNMQGLSEAERLDRVETVAAPVISIGASLINISRDYQTRKTHNANVRIEYLQSLVLGGVAALIALLLVLLIVVVVQIRYLNTSRRNLVLQSKAANNAREAAEEANRAKSEFLAVMSHELRTPLNAIIGFSQIIKDNSFGASDAKSWARYLDYAKDIHDSGQYLLNLINDILDISKLEAGRIELSEVTIDIENTVKSCMALVRERAGSAQVDLTYESTRSESTHGESIRGEAILLGDEQAIKQLLLNLLSNAIKFTPAGGSVRVSVDSNESLAVSVSDTGIGIAAAEIEKLFTPFQQANESIRRRFGGTGLGLSITKKLVELHDGRIDISSEVGSGTTVTVIFPAERVRLAA